VTGEYQSGRGAANERDASAAFLLSAATKDAPAGSSCLHRRLGPADFIVTRPGCSSFHSTF
jgi:hypothetical protein